MGLLYFSIDYILILYRYGQTNCFVGTALKYGVFAAKNDEYYVCTYRAARNMAFQGLSAVAGQVTQVAEVEGSALIGTKVKAPFGIYPEVYVLPMDNVLATKVSETYPCAVFLYSLFLSILLRHVNRMSVGWIHG